MIEKCLVLVYMVQVQMKVQVQVQENLLTCSTRSVGN